MTDGVGIVGVAVLVLAVGVIVWAVVELLQTARERHEWERRHTEGRRLVDEWRRHRSTLADPDAHRDEQW